MEHILDLQNCNDVMLKIVSPIDKIYLHISIYKSRCHVEIH